MLLKYCILIGTRHWYLRNDKENYTLSVESLPLNLFPSRFSYFNNGAIIVFDFFGPSEKFIGQSSRRIRLKRDASKLAPRVHISLGHSLYNAKNALEENLHPLCKIDSCEVYKNKDWSIKIANDRVSWWSAAIFGIKFVSAIFDKDSWNSLKKLLYFLDN